MTDRLNQDSLDVIAAARSDEQPPSESRARVRRGLVMKLGAAGLGTALPTAAAAATGTMSTLFKVVLAVSVVGSAGGIAYHRFAPQTATAIQPVPFVTQPTSPPPPRLSPEVEVVTVEPTRVSSSPRQVVKRLVSPEADLNHLAEETASLVDVREKMRAGLYREALLHLDNYQTRFPRGLLREESEATRVQLSNEQGDYTLACRLARAFVKKWPRSPQGVRMREICETHPFRGQ